MAILWMNLAVVYVFSFFSRYLAKPSTIGPISIKPNKLMAVVVMVSLILVAGLRNNIGDTFFYMYSYTLNNIDWGYVKSNKDVGFSILQMVLQSFSHDPQLLVFVTALITNVLVVLVLYNYSRLFDLSLYVYITSGMFLVSMNGIRQFLAAAIVFAATKYIFNGSWIKYILVIILASFIHQSALILIPIYFIVRRKAWSGVTLLLLSIALLIVIGFNQFSSAVFSVLGDSHYSEYKDIEYQGANYLRVLVQAVPVIIAFLGRRRLRELFPNGDYIVNMSLLSVIIMLIATHNWIFARFNIYFGLYSVILTSWIVKLFNKKDQKLIYYSILICYFIYCYYEEVISLGIIYKSDYIKF